MSYPLESEKRRSFVTQSFQGTSRGNKQKVQFVAKQEKISSGHKFQELGLGDVGGFFWTANTGASIDAPHIVVPYGIYSGPLFATPGGTMGAMAMFPRPNLLGFYGLGATAIARSLPTNPNAGLATFLGEFRKDGLPHLFQKDKLRDLSKSLRNSGDEYLNVEFGWKPIARDLVKFARSVKKSSQTIQQFERDAGRKIRRRYEFPDDTSTRHEYRWQSPGTTDGQLRYDEFGEGKLNSTFSVERKRWFSGAFRYAIPTGNGMYDKARRYEAEANKLLGTRITPEVVWNLAPWSWAADWFGNTGDVFRNVSALSADGLALQYGYVMQHDLVSETHWWQGTYLSNMDSNPRVFSGASATSTFWAESKIRVAATPFGFGLNWDGFSAKQLAIAASIGVTR